MPSSSRTCVVGSTDLDLPSWARASAERRRHIARVTAMLDDWATAMELQGPERAAWHEAGRLHDALRDAAPAELRALADDPAIPDELLHGPAAARRAALDGERRADVLEAIRWHTVGCARWERVGRALYMADYLEPGRPFARRDRSYLADQVPHDFDGTFRQVVRQRLEWCLLEGFEIHPATLALWNSVR